MTYCDKTAQSIEVLKKDYIIWGKNISFETGKLALLANGSVTITDENGNMLLVTAWVKETWVNENPPFFPFVVDFQEKFYATWKIGWNKFQKREGRPSDSAILTARLIDRPIRPMFDDGYVNDTQIIVTVLSSDNESDIGYRWITWASLALSLAWAPFEGPVSGVKVAMMNDGSFVYAPTFEQEEEAKLMVIVSGTKDAITMVEADAKEATDKEMLDILEYSHCLIKEICNAQSEFLAEAKALYGEKSVKAVYQKFPEDEYEKVAAFLGDKVSDIYGLGKKDFSAKVSELEELVVEHFGLDEDKEEYEISKEFVSDYVYKLIKKTIRSGVLNNEKRLDGRALNEVRPVSWAKALLPRTHGSALFQRWLTQSLSVATLGWPSDAQIVDDMLSEDEERRYMHHYNFPPFSVWEVKMLRAASRRDIGHGNLAEKALLPVLPDEKDFPYVVRVVSEITTCNGSSSMASVCGSTMSLLNAWVPLKNMVSWVAMWMIHDEETWNYKIMSDIQAQEDFVWDMDFKVARTDAWITAMQLDVKIKGLTMDVFEKAFAQSKEACGYILDEMQKVISAPDEMSPYAPRIISFPIPVEKISTVIGRGGENVQRMEKEYSVSIHIEDDGETIISWVWEDGSKAAKDEILAMIWEPKAWEKHIGSVKKVLEIWAIVSFKGKDWMIHISKFGEKIEKVEDKVSEGDKVEIEIIKVDPVKGRVELKFIEKKEA